MSARRDFSRASWRLKLARAEHHLEELEVEILRYVDRRPYKAERLGDPNSQDKLWRYALRITDQPHPKIAVVLGDVVHNLRSALDHLAVALAPSERKGTAKFPIESRNIFERDGVPVHKKARERFNRAVEGIAPEAIAIIEELQPCAAETPALHPLGILSRLENADKHRHLVLTTTGLTDVIAFVAQTTRLRSETGWHRAVCEHGTEIAKFDFAPGFEPPESEVHVYVHGSPKISVDISFEPERPMRIILLPQFRLILPDIERLVFEPLEPFVR